MIGRPLKEYMHKQGAAIGDVALELDKLTLLGVFNDISFSVRKGEIVGLGGLVGAGRTDVARAIFGVAPATSGTVKINGKDVPLIIRQEKGVINRSGYVFSILHDPMAGPAPTFLSRGGSAWNDGSSYPYESYNPNDPSAGGLSARHGRVAAGGFHGGHAEWIGHKEFLKLAQHNPRIRNAVYCAPETVDGRDFQ